MANQTVYPYGTGGSLPSSIGIINDLKTGGADKALSAEQGKVIGNAFGVSTVLTSEFSTLTHYKDGYQLKANDEQIGKALDDVTTASGASFSNVKIPVSGFDKVTFTIADSSYEYGSLIVNSSNVVLAGIYVTRGTSAALHSVTIDLPNGSAYLIYSYSSGNDKDVTLTKKDGIFPRLEAIEQKGDSASIAPSSGVSLSISPGRVDNAGSQIADNKYVITEVIFGKFNIILNDDWRIYEGHLYDRSGKLVSYQILNPQVTWMGSGNWPDTWTGRTFYANTNALPDWGMRLVLCKADQSAINEGEIPVKSYVNLTDAGLKRWIPEDLPNYDRALRRIDCLASLRWIPLAKVPNGYNADGGGDTGNAYFNFAGRVAIGVPYSDVSETRKYVPNNVSIRTFMTATKNRRSLLYTEELHENVSKYGMSYTRGHRRCFYGSVCNTFVGWVMGIYSDYLASRYHENQIDGLVTVEKGYQNAKPLDLVWFTGHIAIVSAVWLDEFGNRRYIEMAEMSTPYPYKILYTPEEFDYRTRSEVELHRWNGWDNLPEPEDVRDISQYVLGDVKQEIAYNPDIMCFAGDYAAFAEGDIIHLNARRNSTYTGVELYKDDVLLQTIDITGLSADTIVTPNTEDWVDVNLTTLNLTYGKYKARLTDGTNTTDYTYFEVIDITFTAAKTGSTVTAYFSSNEGIPVSLERVSANGFPDNGVRPITAEMVEAGQATAYNVKTGYPNLMLLVKGDYGTAIKVIPIPTS